jgi:hypothetical protein
MTRKIALFVIVLLFLLPILSGCQAPATPSTFTVNIVIGDSTQTQSVSQDATVADVLRLASITLSDLDRVNPPSFNRVTDGMTITIVRVVQEDIVTQEPLPFERRTTLNDGLAAGEKRLLQAGVNGIVEVTFRVIYEDGKEVSRAEIKRVVTISPQPEVVMVGSQGQLPPVTVNGTLAYISSGNAWIIRGNSHDRRPLTIDGGLDGKAFQLSSDGKRLLYTRSITLPPLQTTPLPAGTATPAPTATPAVPSSGPFNGLWIIPDTTSVDSKPVRLNLNNILYAEFVPGSSGTILYSTAEPRPNFPGWQANNDLWRAQINARGVVLETKMIVKPSSGGIYGWYGTQYAVSPDGETIAWAQADGIGILRAPPPSTATPTRGRNQEELVHQTIVPFTPRRAYDFVWVPTLNWSPDGLLIATTIHGAPVAGEAPEDSPVFNTTVVAASGSFNVPLLDRAGMWSDPVFSPAETPDGIPLPVQIAYFQALQPLDTVASRYQLVIADRDGSNSRVVFPPKDQPGIAPKDTLLAWSLDGRQVAMIYQGNLFLLDLASGLTNQLTQDGLSTLPRWTP